MFAFYNRTTKKLKFEAEEYSCYETPDFILIYDGEILNYELINCETENYDDVFSNVYNFLMYDKIKKHVIVDQSCFGSTNNIYFTDNYYGVLFSTSLKSLKSQANKKFYINDQMLCHFFYNGFIPHHHTLVKGVFKLYPKCRMSFDSTGCQIIPKNICYHDIDNLQYADLERAYDEAINKSIDIAIDNAKEEDGTISLALSGGYDSNCILYKIRQKEKDTNLNLYTVGGVRGVDETSIAKTIASNYDDVSFHSRLVTPNTLLALDDIVERLEGSVYERGLFLQYELASMLNFENKKKFLCGECADQVFNCNSYIEIPKDTFLYGYTNTPLEMAYYVVLKKNALMFKSFGIKTEYPFLNKDVRKVGYLTRKYNKTTKEFHKTQCRKMFPDFVLDNIEKKDGTTSLTSLFDDSVDFDTKIKESRFYDHKFKITKKYDEQEALMDYYLSLKYIESFCKQFCDD